MRSLLFAIAAFSFLCLPQSACAKANGPPPPPPVSRVTAVNMTTHEVSILFKGTTDQMNKTSHVYTLDDISTVTINNVPAKFEDIRVGMSVLGTTERDAHTLDNITLEGNGSYNTPAPAAPKPKPKPAAGA